MSREGMFDDSGYKFELHEIECCKECVHSYYPGGKFECECIYCEFEKEESEE